MSLWESIIAALEAGQRPVVRFSREHKVPVMENRRNFARERSKAGPPVPETLIWKRYARNLLLNDRGTKARALCVNGCGTPLRKDQLVCGDYCREQAIIRYELLVKLLREGRETALMVVEEMAAAGLHRGVDQGPGRRAKLPPLPPKPKPRKEPRLGLRRLTIIDKLRMDAEEMRCRIRAR